MAVVATAGHVDHGKSTLVRALTGMEPDRWAQERRRGMTIDLGYAWTDLPGHDEHLAFVDVPGHERFIANMLAGLGPAPAVMFVVAADEGWRRQSGEHLAAVDALGLRHGLLVVTRSDLADPAPALADAAGRLARTSLGRVPSVAVSGLTGAGLDGLRTALARLVDALPPPVASGRVRFWIDRSFTVNGAGTVVTGTLAAGRLAIGDELDLAGRRVRIRGLEQGGRTRRSCLPVARVGVNLRGVALPDVGRGDVLLTPDAWRPTTRADVRLSLDPGAGDAGLGGADRDEYSSGGADPDEYRSAGAGPIGREHLSRDLVLHIGTLAVPVHVRLMGARMARLTLRSAQPLTRGDRAVLRDPGQHRIVAGVEVLDADPPVLRRRGAAAVRAADLAAEHAAGHPDLSREVGRRGAVRRADLVALGLAVADGRTRVDVQVRGPGPGGVYSVGDWLVAVEQWRAWTSALRAALARRAVSDPLEPGLSHEAARHAAGLPDTGLLAPLIESAGLETRAGRVYQPGARAALGPAEPALRGIEARLAANPFAAPERGDLAALGLGSREVAVAVGQHRLIRLGDDVLLAPTAPAQAMRILAGLAQPFTTSAARQALGSTRRVVVPLLEYLDERGWTERVDAGHRRVHR